MSGCRSADTFQTFDLEPEKVQGRNVKQLGSLQEQYTPMQTSMSGKTELGGFSVDLNQLKGNNFCLVKVVSLKLV